MPIHCPYCSHEMALKGAKPGKFNPNCPACKQKFTLTIPDDPSVAPSVAKIVAVMQTLAPGIVNTTGIDVPAAQSAPIVPEPATAMIPSPPPPAQQPPQLSGRVGGYQVLHKLGEGGMGEVYLARQISLDRNVALKVLSPTLASDPQFVARFTREAYAAAQLTHHNIVQIHDIGVERDVHYFSMEFVQGQNLGDTVREAGKLDAEAAAGYVLQAARGLKFAHDHGMIHRDIKPENLLLNDSGLVKVADLGLVKRAADDQQGLSQTQITGVSRPATSGEQTQMNVSMGTPAYMPPEQARDASHVDQRADIYSLGCTMYDLLTGRPPFMGRTAVEVITKHQREPITPPEMIVRNVPKVLSAILQKMVAKRPEDRYQTMGEVIRALEDFLGVSSAGPFTPREEHVRVLEAAAGKFNRSGWAVLRSQLIHGFYAVCALLIGFLIWFGHPFWAAAILGFGIWTTVAYQIVIGVTQRAHLFVKARQLLFSSSFFDWLSWIVIGALIVTLLVVTGWIWPWFGAAVGSLFLAMGFHFSIDLMLSRDRRVPQEQTEEMLKQMRLRGLDEMALRQFVCRFSGNHWEAFYEALFGYDAKMQARNLWGRSERGRDRRKYAAWRDPIIRWIERKQVARREAREQKVLQKIEAEALAAKGITDVLANKQAKQNARRVVDSAARLRNEASMRGAQTLAPGATTATTIGGARSMARILGTDFVTPADVVQENADSQQHSRDENVEREHLSWFQRRFGSPADLALGPQVRFVLAAVILLGFAMWWQENKGDRALQEAADVAARRRQIDVTSKNIIGDVKNLTKNLASDVASGAQKAAEGTGGRIVQIPMVPEVIRRALSSWNALVAGLILLISVLCTGRAMSFTILLAAAVALVGHWFKLPVLDAPAPAWISAAAAIFLGVFGLLFLRRTEGY